MYFLSLLQVYIEAVFKQLLLTFSERVFTLIVS